MWTTHQELIKKHEVILYMLEKEGDMLSFRTIFGLWQNDKHFLRYFISLLADAPFAAYFWEIPALTRHTLDQPAEFVVVNSPQLVKISADASDFSAHFADKTQMVASFSNLGGDARLLAPLPHGPKQHYAHLANFVRQAPPGQQAALFKALGETIEKYLEDSPVWVSTSGLGVYWLHIRLDSRPKYYQYAPYRQSG